MSDKALVPTLLDLCQKRSSGMLLAVTDDNRHVRIGLNDGEINHVAVHRQRGMAAVEAIAGCTVRNFQFIAGSPLEVQDSLTDTALIIDTLLSGNASAAPAPRTQSAASLDAKTLKIVEDELAEFLGPIAAILIEESKGATSVDALLQLLGTELSSADAQTFINKVKRRIGAA